MNNHLAVLIYLTAARLRQQRLQAGRVGGLEFHPESHARMRWEGSCAMTLYSSSAVSQSMPRAVTVSGCLTSCLLLSLHSISSQPAPTGSSCRWTGVGAAGVVVFAVKHYHAGCRQIRRAWAVTCCIARAQCWSAGPAAALSCSRFLRESSRFIPGNSGTENDRDSRAPGNPHPTHN